MKINKNLSKKLAKLEFINDQLITEIDYVNQLLQSVGFPDGIQSVKAIAQELLEDEGFALFKPKKNSKQRKKLGS